VHHKALHLVRVGVQVAVLQLLCTNLHTTATPACCAICRTGMHSASTL
jgi:hypothetical protein